MIKSELLLSSWELSPPRKYRDLRPRE